MINGTNKLKLHFDSSEEGGLLRGQPFSLI